VKTIALEEHFWTAEWVDYLRSRKDYPKLVSAPDGKGGTSERFLFSADMGSSVDSAMLAKLLDVDGGRLADMDENGIDTQVLCMASGLEPFDRAEGTAVSRTLNDGLARIIRKRPDRFAGLAALAPQDPAGAARELERSVKELGLKGAKLNSHARGETYDDPKFWVIFETAQKLDVPIYLHPCNPPQDALKAYSAYPALSGSVWGFGADLGLNAMKLVCSGLFDKYPGLKIVLGHLGEALPFLLWRLDNRWSREKADTDPRMKKLLKKPGDYIRNNFWVTTSGMFSQPSLLCAHAALGPDRVLFAVDYPYESNQEGMRFLRDLPLSEGDKAKISHLNAEKLLRL